MPIRVLKRGSSGPFVAQVQEALNRTAGFDLSPMTGNGTSLHPPLETDGIYGKLTDERVREFQSQNPPLKIDGKVGPNTWAVLSGQGWTGAEEGKAAKEQPPSAPPPTSAKQTVGHLYVLNGKDFETEQSTGNHIRRSSHKAEDCHYLYVDVAQEIPSDMEGIVNSENLIIKDMIIVGHGSGGGTIYLGGGWVDFTSANNVRMFKTLKGRFAAGAIIWIYACSFAAYREQDNNSQDHDLLQGSEVLYDYFMEGRGYKAMRNIADYTGCEVRAGLDSQTKNVDGFRMAWSRVTPGATRPEIYLDGRLVDSAQGIATHASEQIDGILMKFVTFFK